jgi:histidine triad (HIT) family protein
MNNADNCVFCKIAKGEIPSQFVYEDDQIVAFRDINPAAPTHILIIPREHVVNIAALTEEHEALAGRLILAAGKIARQVGIDSSGYRVISNIGSDGGQSVFHLHLHLLGGRPLAWTPG